MTFMPTASKKALIMCMSKDVQVVIAQGPSIYITYISLSNFHTHLHELWLITTNYRLIISWWSLSFAVPETYSNAH